MSDQAETPTDEPDVPGEGTEETAPEPGQGGPRPEDHPDHPDLLEAE